MAGERVSGNLTRSGKGTLIYALDGTLSCLAVNQKAEHLAVAGRNLFQVLEIRDDCFVPITRSKAPPRHLASNTPDSLCVCSDGVVPVTSTSSSAQAASTTVHRSQNITDVSWSCANTVLASGSTNGTITLWNVDYNLTQQQCFSGHSRSIHCVTFHPTNPWELVTASQDGKVKLFDTREPNPDNNARTFIQRTALPSPVRDVTYSPRHSFLIAAGLENGTISLWDTRQQGRPYWAFQGHSCCVASLDWHPIWQGTGRNWLATAGVADHLIKVWNFDQTTSGQSGCPSVVYTVRTSNVTRIRWRPGSLTQLVSSCNQTFDLNTYLWDLKRPYLPYAAFEGHKGVVTSIAWNAGEADYFYTAGRDGLLIRHCVADGLRPAESAPPVALCFSPRGQLAHAVSRDRFLANQPAPYVDETNLVTQSPFFPGFRGTNGTLDTSSASSMGQSDGPPGFYAAPSCGKLDWYNSSPINLPPMGSAQSAELFVSQAQSLLFCFEPSLEAFRFVGGMASNTVLLSDLIIALAKHYQFVGPNVDRVCSHNAAVALRFGQAFLVQFWSLLRCVYGCIPTISPNKPSAAVPDQEHAKSLSDTKAEMIPPNSADPPRPPVPSDSSIRRSGLSHPRAVNSMPRPSPTASSGVMLRDMLSTIGVVLQCDDPSTPTILSPKRAPSPSDHSLCVVYDPNIKQDVSNLHHSEPQLIVDPTGTLERVHEVLGPFKYPHPVVGSKTERLIDKSEPGLTASVSGTIPIDRQRTSSTCRSRRSPTSAQLFPHGLELSASSAQTCDSLGESSDFLFHYNNPADKCGGTYPETRSALAPTQTDLTAESETNPHDLNPDLLSTVDVSDDPILLETTFLPDEAFSVRHPIEAHLRKVFGELGNSNGGNGAPVSNPNGPEQSTSDSPIRHQNSQKVQTGMSKSFNEPVTIEAQNDAQRSLDQEFRLLAPFNTSLAAAAAASTPIGQTSVELPDATPLIVQWFYELVEYGHVQTVCTALLALGPERLRIKEWISDACIENWFMAYLELLSRFRMWTLCSRITKQCASFVGGVDAPHPNRDRRHTVAVRDVIRSSTRKTPADANTIKAASSSDSGRVDAMEPRTRFRSGSGTQTTAPTSHVALALGVCAVNQASTRLTIHCGRCSKPFAGHEATQRATGHTGWACTRHTDMANAVCALCHLTVKGLFVWCRGCSHGGHLEHIQEWLKKRLECPAGCGHRCEYG